MGRLTIPQVGMYLAGIPRLEYRRHAATAKLAWLVAAVVGNESEPDDWLPEFAQRDTPDLMYSGDVAKDIRTALRLRLMNQDGLDELGGDEVSRALKTLNGGR